MTTGSWLNPITASHWREHLEALKRLFQQQPASDAEAVALLRFFAYPEAETLADLEKSVGENGHCVSLVKHYVPEIGATGSWKPGPRVQDMKAGTIPKGAVIATFWNGRYPKDRDSGKHACFYLSHDDAGIKVVEQWSGVSPKQAKKIRGGAGVIRFKKITLPADQSGASPSMSDTGNYYYLVLDKR